MENGGIVASRIKTLLERRFPQEALIQLFFLHTARAQEIFRDFVVEVYWPKYSSGPTTLAKEDGERFIRRSLDAGRMQMRWSETTIMRVSGYLLGCCEDFGLLSEGVRSQRTIKRFSIRPEIGLYLAYDLHLSGVSDMGLVQHPDWRLFGLEPADVIRLLKNLSHDGNLLIQSSADLVQMSWKYRTMEECIDALTQR